MANLPLPIVIEDGKPVSAERMDPSVMQFIMQAAATAQLVKLRKIEESKIPIGVLSILKAVATQTTEIVLGPPWISFSMINDGPGAVSVWINDRGEPSSPSMIANGESYSCDMTYPIIGIIKMKSASTSTVRIFGKEGNERKS